MELVHRHIFEGGSLITNFTIERLYAMHKAIVEFGDLTLVISNKAYSMPGDILPGYYSLHSTVNMLGDLTEFWKLFEKYKAE